MCLWLFYNRKLSSLLQSQETVCLLMSKESTMTCIVWVFILLPVTEWETKWVINHSLDSSTSPCHQPFVSGSAQSIYSNQIIWKPLPLIIITIEVFPLRKLSDLLFWVSHPLQASCFSVSPFLSPAAALWSVGYSCYVLATDGNNDSSPGQSRNLAALDTEKMCTFVLHICFHIIMMSKLQRE